MRALLLPLLFLLALPAAAQDVRVERVRFATGASSATVQGAVARGERIRYVLGAGEEQKMSVQIESVENNAVFSVAYLLGSAAGLRSEYEGALTPPLLSAWSGELVETGDYVIEVSSTRGGAAFALTFAIR